MKRWWILALVIMYVGTLVCQTTNVPSSYLYTWPQVTATGQLGSALQATQSGSAPRPSNYTIDASVTGTAPTACTFRVEGSSDNQVWYGLDATAPATTSCTASFMEHIVFKPVLYLRINLVTYTAGDGTTRVIFHYTGKP